MIPATSRHVKSLSVSLPSHIHGCGVLWKRFSRYHLWSPSLESRLVKAKLECSRCILSSSTEHAESSLHRRSGWYKAGRLKVILPDFSTAAGAELGEGYQWPDENDHWAAWGVVQLKGPKNATMLQNLVSYPERHVQTGNIYFRSPFPVED